MGRVKRRACSDGVSKGMTEVVRINAVVRDLNEQFEKVNSFSNSRSGFWKGTAANKFYNEISKKYKEIPEVTEKTLPLYLETIKEIVEQNRATDTEINAEQIAKLQTMTANTSQLI